MNDHWEAIASSDGAEGEFPAGLELDLETTYCRRTLESDSPVRLNNAPEQGWEDDPAFQTHGLHCYHGTTLIVNDEPYGTVCFVSEDPRREQFSDGETMFAELVTRMLARELEHEAYERKIARQTTLVSVLNRVLRHNLRNDLSVVRGRIQLLGDRLSEPSDCDIALRNVDDLLAISQKARELERIIGDDRDRQHTDIVALVERVVEDVSQEYPEASIMVEYEQELTVAVRPSFKQAVRELVENAAKHGGRQPTVTVTVDSVPHAVEVRIADDGPGLDETELEVLNNGTETPLLHGSGLGLWLAYWIVSSHDGSIEGTSSEDGTIMTLSVPRSPDGTQRQIAELRDARDRYQAAFESAFDAMIIIDDDARIVAANPEAATIYGPDRQDLLGRSVREFLPAAFDFETAWSEFRNAGRDRDIVTIVGTDGVERQVEYSATTDIIPGQHLIVSRDVTERVQREQELLEAETVFEQAQDAMFLIDVTEGTFRVKRVNESYERLTGLSNAEIKGQTPREIVGEEHGAEIEARYRECIERRETIQYEESIPVDGDQRHWETKLSPVIDDGAVESLVGAMRDVTDRNQ